MMTALELNHAVDNVVFKHHPSYWVRVSNVEGFEWLQIRDASLPGELGGGRKYRISKHMTKSEVVQTVAVAYFAYVEHEARESFTYKGESIFSPHFDVDKLAELHATGSFDIRENHTH